MVLERQSENGNALWFILLAVALMAALTVTVGRSTDTSEQAGTFERNRIQASHLLNHAKNIERIIRHMRTLGLSESDISFENSFISGYQHSPVQPNGNKVFRVEGGGANYMIPREGWLDKTLNGDPQYREWIFTGQIGITDNSSHIPPNDTSLVMWLPYVSRDMCIALNTLLGEGQNNLIKPYDSDTPIEDNTTVLNLAAVDKFNGATDSYDLIRRIDGEGTSYPGAPPADIAYWRDRKSGCTKGSDVTVRYIFFHTLIKR